MFAGIAVAHEVRQLRTGATRWQGDRGHALHGQPWPANEAHPANPNGSTGGF
jgi:hypothetical protein